MTSTAQDPELFNAAEYEIPFTPKPAPKVDELVVRLTGGINLNRNDPQHTALVEALELGQFATLTVTATIDQTAQNHRTDSDNNETVSYTVTLKAHTITLEQT